LDAIWIDMKKSLTVLLLLAGVCSLLACSKSPQSGQATGAAAIPLAQAPSLVPALPPLVPPELQEGKRVFDKTCGLCHGAGVAGAPRPGDKVLWAPRIAQGSDVLYQHALLGYSGATGYMPPRGGAALTDAEVKAGVDYLVAMSR
jgi:cytochrome c5